MDAALERTTATVIHHATIKPEVGGARDRQRCVSCQLESRQKMTRRIS